MKLGIRADAWSPVQEPTLKLRGWVAMLAGLVFVGVVALLIGTSPSADRTIPVSAHAMRSR